LFLIHCTNSSLKFESAIAALEISCACLLLNIFLDLPLFATTVVACGQVGIELIRVFVVCAAVCCHCLLA